QCVGIEFQAACEILGQKFGVDHRVVGGGFALECAADVVQVGGKLLRGARLRAFAQKFGGNVCEALLSGGIGDSAGFDDRRDVDERNAVLFEQQNGEPIFQDDLLMG